jgi:hypothetical protein
MVYNRLSRPYFPKGLVQEAFKKAVLSMTPNEDGSCKKAGCSGLVKRIVFGYASGNPVYDAPRCDTCDKVYLTTPLVEPYLKSSSLMGT